MTDFFEPAGRGVQHASLRAANRRAVLTTIAFNPGISNADVSRRTGLAPQTASAIVAELEAEGMIARGEVLRGRRGQPATPLSLKLDAAYAIGVDVSWQRLDIALIDLAAKPIARHQRHYDYLDAETIVPAILAGIEEMLGHLDAEQRHRLVGIGLASPTNIARKMVHLDAPPKQAERWRTLDMSEAVEKATGISTVWFNNGNSACWAELLMMPKPRPESFAYLYIDTFVAAGIVAEHNIWEGPTGNSANLGSMLVCAPDGSRNFGHLTASILALRHRLRQVGLEPPSASSPMDWDWQSLEAEVAPWIESSGEALAQIILNSAAVIEFDLAVIDGPLPRDIVERLVAATETAIAKLPIITFDRPRIQTGRLGTDATPLGAAFMPIFHKYYSRDLRDLVSWDMAPVPA